MAEIAPSKVSLALPRIGYGTAGLGNLFEAVSEEESAAALAAAWDVGIRHFDTAPHYGLGLSERRLGEFLRGKPRDEFVVSTKVGRLLRPHPEGRDGLDTEDFVVPADQVREWDFSESGIRRSIDDSLERSGLDRFDVLYLHDPERFDLSAGIEQAIPALERVRSEGLTDAIGVGSMDTAALLAGARTGVLDVLMVAGRLTLADQPALAEVVPACRRSGTRIVNVAVFNSGLLATSDPGESDRYDYGDVPADLLERVRSIAAVCRSFGVPLPTAALHYARRHDVVASVVVSGNPDQVRQNVERMTHTVPAELWTELAGEGLIPPV